LKHAAGGDLHVRFKGVDVFDPNTGAPLTRSTLDLRESRRRLRADRLASFAALRSAHAFPALL
jgi:hypothetical protein